MKLRSALTFSLVAVGTVFGSGIAKAQNQNTYNTLQSLYGSDFAGSSATAAFWNPKLVPGGTFTQSGTTSLTAEIALNPSGQDLVLGTTGHAPIVGALTGSGASASFYKYLGSGTSAFFTNVTGSNPPPIGSFSLSSGTLGSGPFAFTVTSLATPGTIYDGETVTDYNSAHGTAYTNWEQIVAAQGTSTAISTNSNDMLDYGLLINGKMNNVLMWNLEGEGSTGSYTDLVVDVVGVKNPEPTSLALMGFGAFGLLGYKIRRRGKPSQTPAVVV